MVASSDRMWMIRAGRNGTVLHRFLEGRVAYLGWGEVGPISRTDTRENVRHRLDETYPYESAGARPNVVGMLRRFSCEVRVGNAFVTVDPQRRLCHIGVVRSDADHKTVIWVDLATGDEFEHYGYVRKVDWDGAVSWDILTAKARRTLNGQLSHFRIRDEVRAEIRRLCG